MVHRLALFDAGGALTNVISQSDVVKFVHDHLDAAGGLAAATVAELGLVQGTVISVRERGRRRRGGLLWERGRLPLLGRRAGAAAGGLLWERGRPLPPTPTTTLHPPHAPAPRRSAPTRRRWTRWR